MKYAKFNKSKYGGIGNSKFSETIYYPITFYEWNIIIIIY